VAGQGASDLGLGVELLHELHCWRLGHDVGGGKVVNVLALYI
jgi:hypothetical protein